MTGRALDDQFLVTNSNIPSPSRAPFHRHIMAPPGRCSEKHQQQLNVANPAM